jgi:hypothetical protein
VPTATNTSAPSSPTDTPQPVPPESGESAAEPTATPYNGGYLPSTGLAARFAFVGLGLAGIVLGVAWARRRLKRKDAE